jgi:NAD-dependent SIR2 family protein deacetylase
MDSVRKALRSGDLEKDMYGRLTCTDCEEELDKRSNPDDVGSLRRCPECQGEWRELR